MLIRIDGAIDGIKEYLETGRKDGRYFSRSQLDERVILYGDLELTNKIIQSISFDDGIEKERYSRYVLSFKEDYIPKETLSDIVDEFKTYFYNAYDDSEYNLYAEAHLPKIKSYQTLDDEIVLRKPHIHLILPRINLLNNSYLSPYMPVKYIDAFQEHINAKYGLSSPKDNIRYNVLETSEFINRYKGDGFVGKGKETRKNIFDDIMKNNISSIIELKAYLETSDYKVKYRNEGKPNQYLNILHNNESINLRDNVFKDDFLKLSLNDKISFTSTVNKFEYTEIDSPSKTPNKVQQAFNEWIEFKSYEGKYLSKLSKYKRSIYRNTKKEDKAKLLQLYHNSYINKLSVNTNNHMRGDDHDNRRIISDNFKSTGEALRSNEEAIRGNAGNAAIIITEKHRRRLRERYRNNIGKSRGDQRGYGEYYQSSATNLREDTKRTVIDEVLSSYEDNLKLNNFINNKTSFKEFNDIRADILLNLLSKSHGIIIDMYNVTVSRDGAERVRCGTRNLSNIDFLTKELNFSFKESINILQAVLNFQKEIDLLKLSSDEISSDKTFLKNEYKQWLSERKIKNKLIFQSLTQDYKEKLNKLYAEKKHAVLLVRNNKILSFSKKNQQLELLKAAYSTKIFNLKSKHKDSVEKFRQNSNLEMQNSYRNFLFELSNNGNLDAVKELRRLRIEFKDAKDANSAFYNDSCEDYFLNVEHRVNLWGQIIYSAGNKDILIDSGKKLDLLSAESDRSIELFLELAKGKFGDNFHLHGTDEFKRKCVDYAISHNLNYSFLDEYSANYYASRINAIRSSTKDYTDNLSMLDLTKHYIMKDITTEQLVLARKIQNQKVFTLVDPLTNNNIKVYAKNFQFLRDIEIGGRVQVYTKNSDFMIKHTSDYSFRKSISPGVIKEVASEFENNARLKHGVDVLQDIYHGNFIKIGKSFKSSWVMIRTLDGEFKKLYNNELANIMTMQAPNKGDIVSIAVTDKVEEKFSKLSNDIEITKNKLSNSSGILLEAGVKNIRGKGVFFIKYNTESGIKHKYGLNIKQQIDRLDIVPGDIIEVKSVDKLVEATKYKVKFEYKCIQPEIDLRLENYVQLNAGNKSLKPN